MEPVHWNSGKAWPRGSKHSVRIEWRRGFTVAELVVLIVVALIVAAIAGLAYSRGGRIRGEPLQVTDGTCVRGIHQGMVLFSQSNKDEYPLPSKLDVENATVDAPAETKDTTANIVSILIYQQFFTPELCVSNSEQNPAIRIDSKYEYEQPQSAANPTKALWDPGFNADFTQTNPTRLAGFSFSHRLPQGRKLDEWNNSFGANAAMVGNRGPKVFRVTKDTIPNVSVVFDPQSITLRIHGRPDSWEGNVVYNDNSVQYETTLSSSKGLCWLLTTEEGSSRRLRQPWKDVLFFDEPDDADGTNNFLVNVKKSGGDTELIWD